jgi:hypothetical protein
MDEKDKKNKKFPDFYYLKYQKKLKRIEEELGFNPAIVFKSISLNKEIDNSSKIGFYILKKEEKIIIHNQDLFPQITKFFAYLSFFPKNVDVNLENNRIIQVFFSILYKNQFLGLNTKKKIQKNLKIKALSKKYFNELIESNFEKIKRHEIELFFKYANPKIILKYLPKIKFERNFENILVQMIHFYNFEIFSTLESKNLSILKKYINSEKKCSDVILTRDFIDEKDFSDFHITFFNQTRPVRKYYSLGIIPLIIKLRFPYYSEIKSDSIHKIMERIFPAYSLLIKNRIITFYYYIPKSYNISKIENYLELMKNKNIIKEYYIGMYQKCEKVLNILPENEKIENISFFSHNWDGLVPSSELIEYNLDFDRNQDINSILLYFYEDIYNFFIGGEEVKENEIVRKIQTLISKTIYFKALRKKKINYFSNKIERHFSINDEKFLEYVDQIYNHFSRYKEMNAKEQRKYINRIVVNMIKQNLKFFYSEHIQNILFSTKKNNPIKIYY